MGFDINGVKLLIKAKQLEVDFDKVITIGRQGLYLTKKEMKNLLSKAGLANDNNEVTSTGNNYAESLLKSLGAVVTDSMDASDYEGATVIQDLNLPISDLLRSKYTLVIDGGSLEHVFNFPVAIKNCMSLIKKDGYYIGITPTNNFLGHGFYQFSPELYFRIFSQANGFRIVKMYFYIDRKGSPIYEIQDPLVVRQRVTMSNKFPSYLFVIAQKLEEKEVFEIIPQQSDYEHIVWEKKAYGDHRETSLQRKINLIKQQMPGSLKTNLYKIYQFTKRIINLYRITQPTGISNPLFFKKINATVKKQAPFK